MRMSKHPQLWFADISTESKETRELHRMSAILDANPQIVEMLHRDLCRGVEPNRGRRGMTAEQVLRAVVLKQQNGFTYQELAFLLNDCLSFRRFCRLPPDRTVSASALQRAIKKLRSETLDAANQVLVRWAVKNKIETGRKVRTDCTVVETNIHKPTDSWLLADAAIVLTRLLKRAQTICPRISYRDHTRTAKRRAYRIENARNKKERLPLYHDLLKVTEKTVGYAEQAVVLMGDRAKKRAVYVQLELYIERAESIIDQTHRRVIGGEKVPASDKIVSLFEAHTDIIVKDNRETLYGHKVCLTAGKSGVILDAQVLTGNPADSTLAVDAIQRVEDICGRPPRQVTFDGAFHSKANLVTLKEQGVKDVVFSRARGTDIEDMAKSPWVYRQLRKFRAGIEGIISFLKRSFGLSRCTWRGLSSFKSYVASSILSANLLILARCSP